MVGSDDGANMSQHAKKILAREGDLYWGSAVSGLIF